MDRSTTDIPSNDTLSSQVLLNFRLEDTGTMFGALNRFISRLDAEPLPQNQSQNANDTSYGFQVLRNTNPDLPLEPWFDFVIGLNGHYIVRDPGSLTLTRC